MKVRASVKKICQKCKIVRRKGKVRVICDIKKMQGEMLKFCLEKGILLDKEMSDILSKLDLRKAVEIVDYYRFPQQLRLSKYKSLPSACEAT